MDPRTRRLRADAPPPAKVYAPVGALLATPLVTERPYPPAAAQILRLFGVSTCVFAVADAESLWEAPAPLFAQARAALLAWPAGGDGGLHPRERWGHVAVSRLHLPSWTPSWDVPYLQTLYPALGLDAVKLLLPTGPVTALADEALHTLEAVAAGAEPYLRQKDCCGLTLDSHYIGPPPEAIRWLAKMAGLRWLHFTEPCVWVLAVEPHLSATITRLGLQA